MASPTSSDPELSFQRGNALLANGRFADALAYYEEALRNRPNHPQTLANMGVAYAEMGKTKEALQFYDAALKAQPRYPDALYNRGNALASIKRYSEALAAYDAAIQIEPRLARVWNNRGLVLMSLGRVTDAVRSYNEALRYQENYPEACNNLGLALQALGQVNDAIVCFEQSLRLRPSFVAPRSNRAQAWLAIGDFASGWPEYEWRWELPRYKLPARNLPLWDGSPLGGRAILLRHEQGLGDTIQFIRYATLVKERGGRVVLECPKALHAVLASFSDVDRFIDRETVDPECDCQAALLSLPRIFKTELNTIPARVPYLQSDPDRIAKWKKRLPGGKLLVGVCWQGNPDFPDDRFRSTPLTQFAPLAEVPGVQLISLQKGAGVEQISEFQARHPLFDLGDDLDADKPFVDTAAVMESLDLIVSSDTSIVHLAGALSRPVWIALSTCSEWRWLRDRSDSPWYPTARLFRQPTLGDWKSVFDEIAKAAALKVQEAS
jgi:Flp pilus assembly protein TadD